MEARTAGRRAVDPIDVHVAHRLRRARLAKGLTQETLGEVAGVSFQQIQKYERAVNRIAPSRLYRFAEVLGIAPGWFFEEVDGTIGTAEETEDPLAGLSGAGLKLARQATVLPIDVQRRLLDLATTLAEGERSDVVSSQKLAS